MNFNFLKYKEVYFIFSVILILASIVCLIIFGLKPGIEFTGGSILRAEYKEDRPSNKEILDSLSDLDLGEIQPQPAGKTGIILRIQTLPKDMREKVLEKLQGQGREIVAEKTDFYSISATIGQELKQKTKMVVVLALLAIVLYIAIAFRRIQRPVKSWQYGIATLLALSHDCLIPLGILSILGKFYDVRITIPVIVALLTVLGYSVNNTVVVFDRIRENLLRRRDITFEETVNRSLNQTLTRSINTSLTTLFVLIAVFLLGGETLKYFSLILILGIIAGTYSSIFLVGPLLVSWQRWREERSRS